VVPGDFVGVGLPFVDIQGIRAGLVAASTVSTGRRGAKLGKGGFKARSL